MDEALPRLETPGPWSSALEGPLRARLEAELPRWLVRHRWFGGKARTIERVELVDAAPIAAGDGAPRVALLRVRYGDGEPELYSLPLAFAAGARADEVRRALPGAGLARLAAAGEEGLLYGADRDPPFSRLALDAIAHARRLPAGAGELVAWSTPAFAAHAREADGVVPRPLGAEQSNTSTAFGDRMILKLFRRTEPGPNPEVEVGAFLTGVAAFAHTPPVLGALEYRPRDGEPVALGILQAFVANRGDAWTFTLGQVAAFLDATGGRAAPQGLDAPGVALVDLAGRSPPQALAGPARPSLDAAALLGRRTAELHRALAAASGPAEFRPEEFGAADRRALGDRVRTSIDRALALLRQRRGRLAAPLRARADLVLAGAGELAGRCAAVLERPLEARRTRVHGDFHLGQVLWTGDDFVLIDFEGEPARPLAERRRKDSPLRDVAGMIRSYHYASHAGLAAAADRPGAAAWTRAWYRWVATAYLRAYLDAAGAGFLPADRGELAGLLDLYLVDKAVYELAYELNNRPEWVGLPLEGIIDLLRADAGAAHDAREDAVDRESTKARGEKAAEPRREAPRVLRGGGPSELDQHLWNEGTNYRAYRTMGAHPGTVDGVAGTSFAVWAPNAERVSVIGDFNGWDKGSHVLHPLGSSGIWQGFLPGVRPGAVYKYHLRSRERGYVVDKADPFGFMHESAPGTQSIVCDLSYGWGDAEWMRERHRRNGMASPMSIYELHLGSWRRGDDDRMLTYREVAPMLAEYCEHMGFTHVEIMPITEHPFYGSWGYQTTGYFAPTSRYGDPQGFMFLVDTLHRRGIGVLLDWVPSHFPADVHGLHFFDGTHLFEHADRRQGHQPDWDSYVFNYGRHEVQSFLLSSALFWLDRYHLDGLRVDAVASMLYLDYSRREGEWIANKYGGRENLEAIAFLRRMNEVVFREYPDVQTVAEESTSWPAVSRPLYVGGLGFGMKWDMGWMHDTLSYMAHDPVFRKYHHSEITFRMMYAFAENFVLPLSHDEVVHGKRSLLDKMPGDAWQKFANLRLLYAYMWAQPGKKLLFMGGEIAQGLEWSHERSLDWHLLGVDAHAGVQRWVRDLNHLLRDEGALHARDFDPHGFEWVDCNDSEESVLTLLRRGSAGDPDLLVALNFTPLPRHSYRVGVPKGGYWTEVLNSDSERYGGAGFGNLGGQEAAPVGAHGRHHSLVLTLPPLGALFFRAPG
jgi:1,4-alpha-glucan branching enzyme